VPTTIYNQPAPVDLVESIKDFTLRALCHLFGGVTITLGTGGYVSNDDQLIVESVYLCKSYASELTPESLQEVHKIAEKIKLDLNQEAVSIEIDNTLDFI
jgi:hypothetical protein